MEAAIAIPLQTPSVGEDHEDRGPDLAKMRRWFRAYETNKRAEISEQQDAEKYYHGKQWTDAEKATLKRRHQPVSTWNRIRRKIDFLCGVEQRMRRDPKAYGRNPQDTETADTITAGLRYVEENTRFKSKASVATGDGLTRGIGIVYIGVRQTRKGLEIDCKEVDADRFFYDPRSVRDDFSDARYMGLEIWLDHDEAEQEWPHADFEKYMDKDAGLASFALEEDRAEQWGDFEHKRVRVVEMWYRDDGDWHYVKFCGDIVLDQGKSPYIDCDGETECPYEAWTCYIDEQGVRHGLVRDLKSIQDEINHRRAKGLHEGNTKQIWTTEGVIDDVDAFREELHKPDGILVVNGVWGQDVGIVDRSKELKTNLDFLMEAKQEIENVGPNPGLVGKGQGVDGASGRALLAQRDSGMTELQPIFDRNRDWKLRCYRKMWARMKQVWTGERWIRVTDNPDAPQYIGINQYQMDPMTGQISGQNVIGEADVDIILEEGPDTVTMQEELYQTLAQLGEAAMSPVGMALIELSGVANKKRILEIIQQSQQSMQDPQAAQMQQQMQELQMRGAQAEVADKEAGAAQKQAQAQKTLSEIGQQQEPQGQPDMHPMEIMKRQAEIEHLDARTAREKAQTWKTTADAFLARDQFELQASQPPANQNQ